MAPLSSKLLLSEAPLLHHRASDIRLGNGHCYFLSDNCNIHILFVFQYKTGHRSPALADIESHSIYRCLLFRSPYFLPVLPENRSASPASPFRQEASLKEKKNGESHSVIFAVWPLSCWPSCLFRNALFICGVAFRMATGQDLGSLGKGAIYEEGPCCAAESVLPRPPRRWKVEGDNQTNRETWPFAGQGPLSEKQNRENGRVKMWVQEWRGK